VNKISEIVLRIKNDDILSEALNTLSMLREVSTKEKINLIDKTLVWVLSEYPNNRINKHQELYENVLASVIKDIDLMNRQEYYRKYLKILYDSNKFTKLLAAARDMHVQFPQDVYPLGKLFFFILIKICNIFLYSHSIQLVPLYNRMVMPYLL